MRRVPPIVGYLAPLAAMGLILVCERELSLYTRLTLDPVSLIILLMIATAWYFGQGPGLLFAIVFELTIDYFTPGPKANVRFSLIVFNRLLLFFAVVLFTSGRRRAEHRLSFALDAAEAANRAKDEFLAIVSHELRTPLNAILGWAAILNRQGLTRETERQAAAAIERNAQAQARLVDDILDVSRIVQNTLQLETRDVPLRPILQEAVEMVADAAAAKRITIRTQFEDDAWVVGDPHRLRQIACNLLSNAVKFTPADGDVRVRLWSVDGFARLEVDDTGIGIDPGFLPYVFDRFRQADASFTRAHGGLGLGLAIVERLAAAHGGRVTATSDGPGRGATFLVLLPLAPEPVEPSLDVGVGTSAV